MEFNEKEYEMIENLDIDDDAENSYTIISKSEDVEVSDFNNVISVIDQNTGDEITYTYNKFMEMLESSGLESFI